MSRFMRSLSVVLLPSGEKTLRRSKSSALVAVMLCCGLLFTLSPEATAQVYNGDLTLQTQSDVDAFNYTSVTGIVFISDIYSNITNLDHLSTLTSVGKSLLISRQNYLENLNGLAHLQSVGGLLAIDDCPLLTNLDSLANLQTVMDLEISGQLTGNHGLKNIDGLSHLISTNSVKIEYNDSLTNINALSQLTSVVGDLKIDNNALLSNIDGLANLTHVGGDLTIAANDLSNLNALSSLTSVTHHLTIGGYTLTDISGLSNLTSVGDLIIGAAESNLDAFSNISSVHYLEISGNSNLSNVNGLSNLTAVNGGLFIEHNGILNDLSGLANITTIDLRLTIDNNFQLTNLDAFANLTSVGFDITINDNPKLTDFCGLYNLFNSGTISGTVNIYRNGANTVTVTPTDVTVNADQGVCSAFVADAAIGNPVQGCLVPVTTTHTPFPAGNIFPVGTTDITWKAKDAANDSASAVQHITVVDNQPPTITCPAGITVSCASDVPAPDVKSVTADDNCSAVVTFVSDDTTNKTCANRFTLTRTYKATDPAGNATTCSQTINVNDDTPPTLTGLTASKSILWPPNHTMRDVELSYTVTDNCTTELSTSVSVSSNEPVNGTGDGDTDPDWQVVDAHHIRLRAERAANGGGRVYTITVTASDGCNAPVSDSTVVVVAHNITGPLSGKPFKIGSTVDLTGEFWDKPGNTHTAKWLIDGTASAAGTVVEPTATKHGSVGGSYQFNAAGVYNLQMNLTDQNGTTSYVTTNGDLQAMVVIYDPNGGCTFGGGWFSSPAGSFAADRTLQGKVSFGFAMSYFKNATNPKGETQFQFSDGGLEFNATNFSYLSISGAKAQFKGSGKVAGDAASYKFILTIVDGQASGGGGVDKIRMKIYNKTTGAVIYDNQMGASDAATPTTAVEAGGMIAIVSNGSVPAQAAIGNSEEELPTQFALEQNYPNPFNPTTTFTFSVPRQVFVTLTVYDVLGREVTTLVRGEKSPGRYTVPWDAGRCASGLYYYRMTAGEFVSTRRLLLMK